MGRFSIRKLVSGSIFLISLFWGLSVFGANQIILARDVSTEISAPRGERVTVTNGRVIRVMDLGAKVRVTGVRRGISQLFVGPRVLEIVVVDRKTYQTYLKLKKIFEPIMGLVARIHNGKLEVNGELLRFRDWQELGERMNSRDRYSFSARLSRRLKARA